MKNTTTSAKFSKSEIFKAAWAIVKTAGKSISEALKTAWAKAKAPVVSGYSKVVSILSGAGAELVSLIVDKSKTISIRYKAHKELVSLLAAEVETQGEFEMPSINKKDAVAMSYNYSKFDIAKFALCSNQVTI